MSELLIEVMWMLVLCLGVGFLFVACVGITIAGIIAWRQLERFL